MKSPIDSKQFVKSIRQLASKARESLPSSSSAYNESLAKTRRPVDYMRCAEFPLAFEYIFLKPDMRVLDIGSPQWFSLYLAKSFPNTQFYYVNILDTELDKIRDIAKSLDMRNISYYKQDVRSLEFDSNYFDKAISISVIEHIAPEVGGDVIALNEIKRVLVSQGELIFSIPLKEIPNIVYQNGVVYERAETERNFFAREYDLKQFEKLVYDAGFFIKNNLFIIERPGSLALDYWEWGPGKNKVYSKLIVIFIKGIEKLVGRSVEDKLATYYLKSSSEVQYRVVNIVANIEKK